MCNLILIHREVDARLNGQCDCAPIPAIYLHQCDAAIRSVEPELNHRDSFPLKRAQQSKSLFHEFSIEAFRDRNHRRSASVRELLDPSMLESGNGTAIVDQHLYAHAVARAVLLQEDAVREL